MYSYADAPPGWKPRENSREDHYYQFTKVFNRANGCPLVELMGDKFICYHESLATYKAKEREGSIHSTWDTYCGKLYFVEHRLMKS